MSDSESLPIGIALIMMLAGLGTAGYISWSNSTHPCAQNGSMCIAQREAK